MHRNKEELPLAATRKSPCSNEDPSQSKIKKNKEKKKTTNKSSRTRDNPDIKFSKYRSQSNYDLKILRK